MTKIWRWSLGLVGMLILAIVWYWPDGQLHVVGCDVGQGDAILISHRFSQVLVDTGRSGNGVLQCLGEQMPFWDRELELVVISHPDDDHVGALKDVLERYRVGLVATADPAVLVEITTETDAPEVKIRGVCRGTKIQVGEVRLEVMWPPEQISYQHSGENDDRKLSKKASNNESVGMLLKYGCFGAFLGGDLEYKAEVNLVGLGPIEPVTLYKVHHHGSRTSSSEVLLDMLRPKLALISVGRNNPYGHPDATVIERLEKQGIKVLRTDVEGTVEVVSDGERYWIR